ncbi:MAG: DUF2461 domain-containing protein [Flavobacteriales bacterium]|nr:DUF2461 domain-containing protein [Flavobacteriales bacterium]
MEIIFDQTILFLKNLSNNNNREWFNEHKTDYISAKKNLEDFIDGLKQEMNLFDVLENKSGKKSLFRIYNDVRFKKDKTPYNPRFAFGMQREGKHRRGGYYMQIKPGETILACGFFGPEPSDLLLIRKDIEVNYLHWFELLSNPGILSFFEPISGEKVKTAPKGFDKNHPAIELLRMKQFIFKHSFSDPELTSKDFQKKVCITMNSIRPFFDYMSEVLTTDANGVSIL